MSKYPGVLWNECNWETCLLLFAYRGRLSSLQFCFTFSDQFTALKMFNPNLVLPSDIQEEYKTTTCWTHSKTIRKQTKFISPSRYLISFSFGAFRPRIEKPSLYSFFSESRKYSSPSSTRPDLLLEAQNLETKNPGGRTLLCLPRETLHIITTLRPVRRRC